MGYDNSSTAYTEKRFVKWNFKTTGRDELKEVDRVLF